MTLFSIFSSGCERPPLADIECVQAIRRGPSRRTASLRQETQNGHQEQAGQLGAQIQRDFPLVRHFHMIIALSSEMCKCFY